MNNHQGINLHDYQLVQLSKEALTGVDLQLYTSLRAHFLVHAVQSGNKLPSESSMVRSERRNGKKSKKDEEEKKDVRARATFERVKIRFQVPNRYGAKLPKYRRRGRGGVRPVPCMPISFNLPLMPSATGPMAPGSIGLPPMRPIGMPLPGASLPGMPPIMPFSGMTGLPSLPGLSGLPLGLPSISVPPIGYPMIPMMPPPSVSLPFPSSVLPSRPSRAPHARAPSAPIPTLPVRKIRAKRPTKIRSKAFKIQSPQQIALKCARQAALAQLQKWRKNVEPEIVENVNEEIPLYFRKKKASQKRRREEKHELIKKNRKRLYEIYGEAIYSRGWPISRKEILQALEIKQETQVDLEGLQEMMQENNEPKQESSKPKEQPEQEVKLFLLKEEPEQLEVECSVPAK